MSKNTVIGFDGKIKLSKQLYRQLPTGTKVSADYTDPSSDVEYIRDGEEYTYWFSGYVIGTVRILFETKKEWISSVQIKTFSPFSPAISNEFTIYGKENRSDNVWVEIGKKTAVVTSTDSTKPQTVDIDVLWNEYEVISIKCNGIGLINEVELF